MLSSFYWFYVPGVVLLLALVVGIPYYRTRARERDPHIPSPRERDEAQAYREARARAQEDVNAPQPPPPARQPAGAASPGRAQGRPEDSH